ncbi:MAG: sodium:solute symporter [Actinobacteria bacterium 13_1_20CM_3_71_11]|nr:MAG: sodium:solute symporter [Actinobacteria bacterium 13_1_20CM_3_71_11]
MTAGHKVQFAIFVALFGVVTVVGFGAARWRRPDKPQDLEEWGLGGRAFGNFVTWFLVGGDLYTAYTFVAVPALVYGDGAYGFFAVPFAVIGYPIIYPVVSRLWSVAHTHGFITPAEFVRARFGSRTLATGVAVVGIVATMPYIALQLIGLEAVLRVLGVPRGWPLTVAFVVLALYTFRSGLRAPALISIVKDVLLLWTVLAALLAIAMTSGGWGGVFRAAGAQFARTGSGSLILPGSGQLGYVTLVLGSALALFLYPHAQTGFLAARNRRTVKRNVAALPVYTFMLGLIALLGFAAIANGVRPVGGDGNTIIPALFDTIFPDWCAGLAMAAIGIGALLPAAIMSIAAANLFTRSIYREFFRPHASPAEETRVGKLASVAVKLGAVLVILLLDPQFSIEFQLIGGVLVLQLLPAVAIGLYTAWPHRWALVSGLAAGLVTGTLLLYQIPQLAPNGRVTRAHFGGSNWPLTHLGFHTRATVYAGLIALAVNFAVTVVGTLVLRAVRVPAGVDMTDPGDYLADESDGINRMAELVDGTTTRRPSHLR